MKNLFFLLLLLNALIINPVKNINMLCCAAVFMLLFIFY